MNRRRLSRFQRLQRLIALQMTIDAEKGGNDSTAGILSSTMPPYIVVHHSLASMLVVMVTTVMLLVVAAVVIGTMVYIFRRLKQRQVLEWRRRRSSAVTVEDPSMEALSESSATESGESLPFSWADAWRLVNVVGPAELLAGEVIEEAMSRFPLDSVILASLSAEQRAVVNAMTPRRRWEWLQLQRQQLQRTRQRQDTLERDEESFLLHFPQAQPVAQNHCLPQVVDGYVVIPFDRVDEFAAHAAFPLYEVTWAGARVSNVPLTSVPEGAPDRSSSSRPDDGVPPRAPSAATPSPCGEALASLPSTGAPEVPQCHVQPRHPVVDVGTPDMFQQMHVHLTTSGLAHESVGMLRRLRPGQVYGAGAEYLPHDGSGGTPADLTDLVDVSTPRE